MAVFTSTTSPATGQNSSDTAFTASMVPKGSILPNLAPGLGSST